MKYKKTVDSILDYVIGQTMKINTDLLLNDALLENATPEESGKILSRIDEIRGKLSVLADVKDIIAKGI